MPAKTFDKMTAQCTEGLGNRMKVIYSAIRQADEVDVYWTSNTTFKYGKLHEYFPDLVETKTRTGRVQDGWRLTALEGDVPEGFSNKNELLRKYTSFKHVGAGITHGKFIDFEYNRIPQNVRDEYCNIINSVRIADHILEEVDKFISENNFDDETVSAHIRTFYDSKKHQQIFSWDRYVEDLLKYKGKKIFVATDDKNIIEPLKEIMGENSIITRKPSNFKYDPLVDMLLLSKNNWLVGSPWSTFSELSWWLGGAKAHVDIAWKEPEWKA